MCSIDFLKDILAGKRKLVKLNQVRFVSGLERFTELTISSLMDFGLENVPNYEIYFPQDVPRSKLCREYVAHILNTLDPGCVDALRVEAINRSKLRNRAEDRGNQAIQLTQEFANILHNPIYPLVGNRRLLNSLSTTTQDPN